MGYGEEFFKKWFPTAQRESELTGIPASVILAQGLIESTSKTGGKLSTLATKANNFFGIKADSRWDGPVYTIASGEEVNGKTEMQVSGFRKYASAEQSWADHSAFLLNNPRYTEYGVFSSNDPRTVAQALQNAGYATNSNYANDIMKVINQYNLTQYDKGYAPIKDPKNAKPRVLDPDSLTWMQKLGLGIGLVGVEVKDKAEVIGDKVETGVGNVVDSATEGAKNIAQSAAMIVVFILLFALIIFLVIKMIPPVTATKS